METIAEHDKDQLLAELDSLQNDKEGIGLKSVVTALAALALAVGITIPKVYLSSSIYYVSLETDSLYSSYKSLKEENRYLEQKLELMKYKNYVLRSLD